jgi:hypothetical protein
MAVDVEERGRGDEADEVYAPSQAAPTSFLAPTSAKNGKEPSGLLTTRPAYAGMKTHQQSFSV